MNVNDSHVFAHQSEDAQSLSSPLGKGIEGEGASVDAATPDNRPVDSTRPSPAGRGAGGEGASRPPPTVRLRDGSADAFKLPKQQYEANKLAKRLRRQVGEAIGDYDMIGAGDRVMVCLSGGKDSYGLLDVLLSLRAHAPIDFEIIAVNLDQRHPGYPAHVLPEYLETLGVPYRIEVQDTYSVVKRVIPAGKTMCSLCSRLRRGVLYRVAKEVGATRIALGHHRDDILETFFLNLFFGGKLKAMPPKLVSDDGAHVVIRPLAYVAEHDLAAYAELKRFPIIPCDLCGSQPTLQRKQIKLLLQEWEKRHPGRSETIFRSLGNVRASHLLDRQLFDFAALAARGVADADGDKAFDRDEDWTLSGVINQPAT